MDDFLTLPPHRRDDSAEPNHAPLVSVVIIFLDCVGYLPEAVESVRAQTWQKWELLLVDDGSTDGSTELAHEYVAADPQRIRYVHHENHLNRGMSASRNLGAACANGDWIALLDADDVWLPETLSHHMASAREFPEAELIYGPGISWFSWDPHAREADSVRDIGFGSPTLVEPPGLLWKWWVTSTPTPCTGGTVMRRAAYERIGGFEEGFRGLYEDQAFYLKAALHTPILATPEITMLYRQHDQSCCSVSESTRTSGQPRQQFLRWAVEYMKRNGVEDSATWRDGVQRAWFEFKLFSAALERKAASSGG